jgi:hypothetical protein
VQQWAHGEPQAVENVADGLGEDAETDVHEHVDHDGAGGRLAPDASCRGDRGEKHSHIR